MPLRTKAVKLTTYFLFRTKSLAADPKDKKSVFIRIDSIEPNRRLFQIVSQFLYCGYTCYLDIPFTQYIHSDIFGRIAALKKNVKPAKNGKKYNIIVSDKQEILDAHNAPLKIFLNLNIFKRLNNIIESSIGGGGGDEACPVLPDNGV
ncbi:MAG: hypothetical protein LBG43_03260 [Treponema sp.]|nr:hypothetical protein [Treponema sp.]